MVSNRSYYAVLTLCLFGCGTSAATKDEPAKAPPPSESASPKAAEASTTETYPYKPFERAHRMPNSRGPMSR